MSLEKSGNTRTHTHAFPEDGSAGARKVFLGNVKKTLPWKPKMKHVVKCDAILDILLVGSMYVTKQHIYVFCRCSRKTSK